MQPEPLLTAPPAALAVRGRVDETLEAFLLACRDEMAAVDPQAGVMVDELRRLLAAGGKRVRPAFCYWGHLAAGGQDAEPIVRAAASLELFHTFALVHDDVMDESRTRRSVASTHARFAAEAGGPEREAERYGRSVAILVGDLAAVLADRLLVESGFPPERLLPGLRRYDRMRIEVAAGQLLDVSGPAADESQAARVAALKTGAYTVEGPLHIGAILAGGSLEVLSALSRYAAPLGEAFQLRDDVLDHGEGVVPGATSAGVNELIERALAAAESPQLPAEAAGALRSLAEMLRLPER